MMILYKLLLLLLGALLYSLVPAESEVLCKPLVEHNRPPVSLKYGKGVLWQISKSGQPDSYVFGTIHIASPEVLALPEPVSQALNESEQFVMEALPDTDQLLSMSSMMFFQDGQRLSDLVDDSILLKMYDILSAYMMMPEVVEEMKPWTAFLIMNYPPESEDALDLVLLSLARKNGASVMGLETLEEQMQLFDQLTLEEQVTLLTDTVCHYDVVENDFAVMKQLYLQRDLAALFQHGNRFDMIDEALMRRLIQDRNHSMVERIQTILPKGKTFVAIGAMHLSGDDGVLALLEQQGYKVSVIY